MANDNNYFEFLDIPNGSGGTVRWYAKDAEARAAIEELDPASVENKADKVSGATNNNLAALDSNGNLKDSGKAAGDFATAEQGAKADFAIDVIGTDTDYEYVDLGLPSGTLWARCNVGASVETGYGNYYMYGMGTEQYDSEDTPYAGTEDPLDAAHDTATQVMGEAWKTPTIEQYIELVSNTTNANATIDGVAGRKFTAANGNYVFFPYAGLMNSSSDTPRYLGSTTYLWSSTPYEDNARMLNVENNSGPQTDLIGYRAYGYSVRGVYIPITEQLGKKADRSELPTSASVAETIAALSELT